MRRPQDSTLLVRWKLINTGVATRKPPLLGIPTKEKSSLPRDSDEISLKTGFMK